MSAIKIRDQKICGDLIKLGVVERKSKILECPDVPQKYIPHFVRGVVDGDGSVECGRHTRVNIYTSSRNFAYGLSDQLHSVGVQNKVYVDNRCNYTIRVSRQRDIYNLFNMMYRDADIFLDRKMKKMKSICDRHIGVKNGS